MEIRLNPNDQKDILDLLKYALEKKKKEKPDGKFGSNWNDSKYWEIRIPQLIDLVNGRIVNDSIMRSTLSEYRRKL